MTVLPEKQHATGVFLVEVKGLNRKNRKCREKQKLDAIDVSELTPNGTGE